MIEPRTVLITGASSGIGRATTIKLLESGFKVVATARREAKLQEIRDQYPLFSSHLNTLVFDVSNRKETEQTLGNWLHAGNVVDVLINNAGLARGLADVSQGSIEDWEEMIDTNVKGLLYVSQLVSRSMLARKKGHIINIGSTAGKEAYPNGNVYCASKFAVDALTQAMRMDWVSQGIKVSALHPGYVETDFSLVRFHGDQERAEKVYQGFEPLKAEDVADVLLYMIQAPTHVNLADVLLMCTAQACATITHKEL